MKELEIFNKSDLVDKKDLDFLTKHQKQLEQRFITRSIFRSRFEMEKSVLADDMHPTPDSKYFQAIGEQSVHLSELISLVYESQKLEAEIELLQIDIEVEKDNLKSVESRELRKCNARIQKLQAELGQKKFGLINQKKTAQERMREIKTWEDIIQKLEPQLKHGKDNFELHHPERYMLRYQRKSQYLDVMSPEDKVHTLSMLNTFTHANQIDYESKEELMEKDKIAATYLNRDVRKILVASPHRLQNEKAVTNFHKLQPPATFEVMLEEPYGYSVPDARNFVVKKAIEEGFEYIFFVDDDLIIPVNSLVQLLHHDADIVGGFYYRKYFPLESCGMFENSEGLPVAFRGDMKIGEIIHNTLVLPSGCTLIKTEAFKRIEEPWYKTLSINGRPTITEDTYITQRLRELGFNIVTDTGIQCIHVDKQKGILYGHSEIVKNNEVVPEWRDYFAV